MRSLIIEIFKTSILGFSIIIGVIYLGSIYKPVHVKADKLQEQGKNIGRELTKKEMDEYMTYLQGINNVNGSVFIWELPATEY
jgi:predicted hydrocarbon binding protein